MQRPRSGLVTFVAAAIFLLSCKGNDGYDISTYDVSRGSFENILYIDGSTEAVRATTITTPMRVNGTIAFLVEDGTYVEAGDTVCVIEMPQLEDQYDSQLLSLENAEANFTKTRANLDMEYALLEAQVQNNEADTRIARMDSLQLAFATPSQRRITELELEKVAIDKARYEKKLQTLEVINQTELKKIELEIQRLNSQIQTVRAQLDELVIKAPHTGLAVRAINWLTGQSQQVGDQLFGSFPIVNIPDKSQMKVKIRAPEADYKLINVGDSVWYTFDAMPGNTAYGRITMKAPVGQPLSQGSRIKMFDIEASIDSTTVMPDLGLTVNCNIILKEIRDTIVVPQIAVFDADSIKAVYVERKRGYEMRQVLTGTSSPKEIIVTHGLQGGEAIALSRPRQSQVTVLLPDSIVKPMLPDSTASRPPDSNAAPPPAP